MARKASTASLYTPVPAELIRSACLTLATYLGSFLDELVLVGGLVPSLLVEQADDKFHVGTQDIDIGLHVALLDASRYQQFVEQLKSANFTPDLDEKGKVVHYRWCHTDPKLTVDFLIQPGSPSETGKIRAIDADLSALQAAALPLAFRDRVRLPLTGKTLKGEAAERDLWVCGPGAFLVLKAHAWHGRGENKDAYDLLYMLEHYGEPYLEQTVAALQPLLVDDVTQYALDILRRDYLAPDAVGIMRAAEFLSLTKDEAYRADRAGAVKELLRRLNP